MKNNLLKSVATVATASALLFSTVTSFAATATTVTTYKEGGKVGVTSTIKDAEVGKMITYLASYNADGTVKESGDIAYIGQKTVPSNGVVTFSYDISKSGVTAGDVIAKVRYGSDDSATATALNKDATSIVKYGALTITSNNCTVKPDKTNIGNGESVNVSIEAEVGYEVDEIYINGVIQNDIPQTVSVTYDENGTDLVVICGAVKKDTTAVVKVADCNEDGKRGIICHGYKPEGTKDVTFGVVAKNSSGGYYNLTGIVDGFYAAEATDGYYAVQIETNEDITLTPVYMSANVVSTGN